MKHAIRVRAGLVSVAALLAVLVTIQPGHSQFEPVPPPAPPVVPMPPPVVGGPMAPSTPRPPVMPGPGMGGPRIYEWRCGRCGRVLGSGTSPPSTAYCPFCRVTNTIPHPGGGAIQPGIPVAPPPGGPLIATPPPPAPDPGMGPPGPAFEGGVHVPPGRSDSSSGSSRITGGMVVVIAMGVLLLLGIGFAAVIGVIIKQQNAAKRRRPRPRRRYRDDHY